MADNFSVGCRWFIQRCPKDCRYIWLPERATVDSVMNSRGWPIVSTRVPAFVHQLVLKHFLKHLDGEVV